MRLFLCYLLVGLNCWCPLSFANDSSARLSDQKCDSPFGKKLGRAKSLVGYSNCNSDWESDEWNTIILNGKKIKTGLKWQCVEYARRWYITQLGYTFASIDHAYQIWELDTAAQLKTQKKIQWLKFYNGKTITKPAINDLLIYNKKQGIHGHVAVITAVKSDQLFVAEQNHTNKLWKSKNYARQISFIKNQKGQFKLEDLGVIGWMRVKK